MSAMIASVAGAITASLSRTRSIYSYWPDQFSEYPGGKSTFSATARRASRT